MNTRSIPLLVTMDLELAHDHDLQEQQQILERLGNDLNRLGVPATIFATSEAVKAFAVQVKKLIGLNNEIGLHGMTHARDEDFTKLPLDKIRTIINSATDIIESVSGSRPRCFRGPFMSTSAFTQKVLVENGFIADLSVCSQRVDEFNAAVFQKGWVTAPRRPYYPSEKSPYKKGKVPLLVIPMSCLGLPFISGTLYLLGLRFMKIFFRILLKEASSFSRAVVYMFHSYEFSHCLNTGKQKILHQLYLQDREKRYQKNLMLLKYMCSGKSMRPMTCSEFVGIHRDKIIGNNSAKASL